jgi:hypothetical protein
MNLRQIAVAGVSTAIAAGALVGATGAPANAVVTGNADYTCTIPGSPAPVPLNVGVSGDIPVSSLPAGTKIDGLQIPMDATLTVPAAMATYLKTTYGVNHVSTSSDDFAFELGTASIPVEGLATAEPVEVVTNEDLVLPNKGVITEVSVPGPGEYFISLPNDFNTLIATDSPSEQAQNLPAACTLNPGEDPKVTPFTVTKQGATVALKAPAKVKKGKALKINTTVKGANLPATGKVTAKNFKTGKTLATGKLKKGKALLSVKSLKKTGTYYIDVLYGGDKNTAPSQASLVVKVTK